MKISVKVKAGFKTPGIKKVGDTYEVSVNSRPIEGKANQEVIGLLSKFLNVSKSQMKIKSGLKSKNKLVEING